MKRIFKGLLVTVLVASLVGCSSGGSKSGKPTVSNQKSQADAYEYLAEIKLTAESESTSGTEREDFFVYLPGKENIELYDANQAYSYLNGVDIDVTVNDYFYEEGAFADDVLAYDYEDVEDGYNLLKVVKLSDVVVDEKRDFAYFSAVTINETYSGEGEANYQYFAAKELSPKQRITIQIEVESSECNKLTEAVIAEIEEYYEIDVDFDLNELTAAQDEFNANPPETKVYDGYGYSFEMPYKYQLDYDNSDYSDESYSFGENGDSTTLNNNLQVIMLSEEASPLTADELKAMADELLTGSEEATVVVADADFTSENKTMIKCTITVEDEHVVGYFVSVEEYIFYFAVHTDSTELTAEAANIIQTAINTLDVGY